MTPKKLHRFLIQEIPAAQSWRITDEHIMKQLFSVLKVSIGESIILFVHNGNDVIVTIQERDKHSFVVQKISEEKNYPLNKEIIAAVSITKGAAFELIVQKLTEIGVQEIVPLLSNRTVKQSIRLDRLQKISNEALEQSGGNTVVTIHPPTTLSECLKKFTDYTKVVCDAHTGKELSIPNKKVILFIGPEGGWDEKDASVFSTYETQTLSLGTKILRTETAAIIAAHKLLWEQ